MSIKFKALELVSKVKANSPTILLVGGTLAIVSGTVMACVATTKLDKVVDNAKEQLDIVRESVDHEIVTKEEGAKLKTGIYAKSIGKTAVLYLPATLMITSGITAIMVSHRILRKRNLALAAACEATSAAFNKYRRNVVSKYGVEEDYDLMVNDYSTSMTKEQAEAAEETDTLVDAEKDMPWLGSLSRCFDESNPNWSKNPEDNLHFLVCQCRYLNELMLSRRKVEKLDNNILKVYPGHLLAREIYSTLGWDRPEDFRADDAIVGIMTDGAADRHGTGILDFGIFCSNNEGAIQFVHGAERSVWINPNFDGAIYDKIGVPIYFNGKGERCDKHGEPIY